jgi:hypothetical protein
MTIVKKIQEMHPVLSDSTADIFNMMLPSLPMTFLVLPSELHLFDIIV